MRGSRRLEQHAWRTRFRGDEHCDWTVRPPQRLACARQSWSRSQEKEDSPEKFAGTWERECQDRETFVVVALRFSGAQFEGTVSVGNMQGGNPGARLMVSAPPVAEYAQEISKPSVKQNILSFEASGHPDRTFARFELKRMESTWLNSGY
jgi:hypothetical protein